MNKENVLRLADHLERLRTRKTKPRLGFNMGTYYARRRIGQDKSGHDCGTVACIAGHAYFLANKGRVEPSGTFDIRDGARDFLGLMLWESGGLFTPSSVGDLRKVSLRKAIKVLRRLAKTGNVDWT